jgi:hypothetical protein
MSLYYINHITNKPYLTHLNVVLFLLLPGGHTLTQRLVLGLSSFPGGHVLARPTGAAAAAALSATHLNAASRFFPGGHRLTQRLVLGLSSFPAGHVLTTPAGAAAAGAALSATHLNAAFRFFPGGHRLTQRLVLGLSSFPAGHVLTAAGFARFDVLRTAFACGLGPSNESAGGTHASLVVHGWPNL